MRNLDIKATPWQQEVLPDALHLPSGVEAVVLETCQFEGWHYQRLQLQTVSGLKCYLYVDDGDQAWVLGVFDTLGQADFFLALHNANPLYVPTLLIEQHAPAVRMVDQQLHWPVYAGLYRVGFKSYRVELVETEADWVRAEYIDGYRVESLGEGPEIEVCLQVYSHFDGRLRGCKMC